MAKTKQEPKISKEDVVKIYDEVFDKANKEPLTFESVSNKVRYVEAPPTPKEFLASKGHSSVHDGQRVSLTFEEVESLLKEYREL